MRALVVAALPEEALPGVVITGDGPIRAERGAAEAVAGFRPEALIGIGIGGGISPRLKRGDVVVGRDGDSRLVNAAIACGATPVTIATTREIVLDKRAVDADVVDMESEAWRRAAGELPFVAIRVILDAHDESLPPFLAKCARDDGSIDRLRVALRAPLHPLAIFRLARQTNRARKVLQAFVSNLLASIAAIPYDR